MPFTGPVLQIQGLDVSLEDRSIFRQLSLEVAYGETLCIVGAPGSGKSLLLEFMAGRAMPHVGQLTYPGWIDVDPDAALGVPPRFAIQLVSTREQRRIAAGYASFHQARWHSPSGQTATVASFVSPRATYGLRDYEQAPPGLQYPDHEAHCTTLLQKLGIEYLPQRPLSVLSNGEWRKLLLARALLARPRLLLLDDPLGGLDPDARVRVVDALGCWKQREHEFPQLTAKNGSPAPRGLLTLVVTTPRPDELNALTTRTIELRTRGASLLHHARRGPQHHSATTLTSGAHRTNTRTDLRFGAPVVRLRNATVRSGETTLLDRVSLEVTRGQHWLITGPNGAGKSTLLALLLGDHPQSYAVDLEVLGLRAGPGVPLRERQRRIGFMAPELAAHYPLMWSVRDAILSGVNASVGQFVAPSTEDEQRADAWLQEFDLVSDSHRTLGSLSEAQTRRVFLARAVMGNPALLVLDEPTQGLTQSESRGLLDIVDSIVQQRELTLIIVSHHALERPRCVTHQLSLAQGRVVAATQVESRPHG